MCLQSKGSFAQSGAIMAIRLTQAIEDAIYAIENAGIKAADDKRPIIIHSQFQKTEAIYRRWLCPTLSYSFKRQYRSCSINAGLSNGYWGT